MGGGGEALLICAPVASLGSRNSEAFLSRPLGSRALLVNQWAPDPRPKSRGEASEGAGVSDQINCKK